MAKKDDLDMQTFQIYQDEETVPVLLEEDSAKPQKKSIFDSLKKFKPEKKEVPSEQENNQVSNSSSEEQPNPIIKEALKGVVIGIVLLTIFILIDTFVLKR